MKLSRIARLKSQFFINRALIYFSFLLIPVWVQKSVDIHQSFQAFLMVLYILFMAGQWFLLGKEVDHRLKIYVRVNSSFDRVLYRLLFGMVVMLLYFNLLYFLPTSLLKHFFWGTWVVLGLFYSWPTRGKIIQETVSTQFYEFRFLDSFEKTVLGLTLIMLIVSFPQLPSLENPEALKLYFDPLEKLGPEFWNFLTVNYFPFRRYPQLIRVAWSVHFYLVGMGLYLLAFYSLLRYFVSRRLSLLGVFALISSWSFSKILESNLGAPMTHTFSIFWVWGLLWVTKSSTYRAGFFFGLLGYWGTVLNQSFGFLLPIQLFLLHQLFFKDKTAWFKRQFLKYASFGLTLTVLTYLMRLDSSTASQSMSYLKVGEEIVHFIERKAFYILSALGAALIFLKIMNKDWLLIRNLRFDLIKLYELLITLVLIFVYALFGDASLVRSFSLMWIIVFFSVIPLEWIFQAISRLRSRRNMIFAIYILICLLDSHFEGRIKIFAKLFS